MSGQGIGLRPILLNRGHSGPQQNSSTGEALPEWHSWSHTKTDWCHIKHQWIIDDFPLCASELAAYLDSKPFYSPDHEQFKFHLRLYPNGSDSESEGFLALSLHAMFDDPMKELEMKCLFCLINNNGKKSIWNTSRVAQDCINRVTLKSNNVYCIKKFFSRKSVLDSRRDILNNLKLTISCELAFSLKTYVLTGNGQTNSSSDTTISELKQAKCQNKQYYHNLGTLLDNGKFSDVTLTIGDKEYPAHRSILIARSSVFEAIFNENPNLSRIEIEDIPTDVFDRLLRFIYNGDVPDQDQLTVDLFSAANKFEIQSLIKVCEESLLANLNADTVATTLLQADIQHANTLKRKCIEFITENSTDVMFTESWEQIVHYRPNLVTDMYEDLAKKFTNSKRPRQTNKQIPEIVTIKDEPE